MRNWPQTLPNASFRGVPFFVETEDLPDSGREVAVHPFVKSEDHATEDMGRKVRRFRVDGYVASDAADAEALLLVETCSVKGDGVLLLPLNGFVTVKCTNCSTSMHKDQLGRIKVQMDFVESGNDSSFSIFAIGDRLAASAMGAMGGAVQSVLSSLPF